MAPLEKRELAVGDSTRLLTIFATREYSGDKVRLVNVLTDKVLGGRFTLYLTATVVPISDSTYPVVVDPWHICADRVNADSAVSMEFSISNATESLIRLRQVSLSDSCLRFNLPNRVPAGGAVVGTIEFEGIGCTPLLHGSMTFEADDPENSRITIPVERSLSCGGTEDGGGANACSEDGSERSQILVDRSR